jgi:hypothetical protein
MAGKITTERRGTTRTTINRQYSIAASRVGDAAEKANSLWTRVSGRSRTARVRPKLPQVDLVPAVERCFDFAPRRSDWSPASRARGGAAPGQCSCPRSGSRRRPHLSAASRNAVIVAGLATAGWWMQVGKDALIELY